MLLHERCGVCLSIKDINLLIKETGRQRRCMRMQTRVDEGRGGTITRQQRTVLFKCENLKMGAVRQTREREGRKSYVLAFSYSVLSFFLLILSQCHLPA